MEKQKFELGLSTKQVLGLMILAYLFSVLVRMIWVYQFKDTGSFYWNGQLMINTNDGYFFAAGAQKVLYGLHELNPRVPDMWRYGVVALTVFLTKVTPFSLETIILYLPALVSSLVVIPMILIARLYKQTLWGFFAALLGSIAWSYYNRTMTGYYDTDMFSAMAPMFILYFLMKSTIDFNLRSALYAAIAIAIYPFLYDQGRSLIYAMGIIYALYMVFYHREEKVTYSSLILVFVALLPVPVEVPWNYLAKILILVLLYVGLIKVSVKKSYMIGIAFVLFLSLFYFGNIVGLILSKVMGYIVTGTIEDGKLHFYAVNQTVREAGHIPFSMFAKRISGSELGLILSVIGYILLTIRYRAFLLALPLVGIGGFALLGGLRFTVYAVPVAAMSALYLFLVMGDMFKDKRGKYAFVVVATVMMLYPNIWHIVDYRVPTVMKKAEVQDLAKLNNIADTKDYTLTWWDYGYPIWYYSDTNTLIDGGKHNNDNFIISKILQTTSPELAANLSRLAVETYINTRYKTVADTLFSKRDPNEMLMEMESGSYKLPSKTREIYLYLPLRMLNIFPTVTLFGNLNLKTGKALRKLSFYPTTIQSNRNGVLQFRNRISFDAKKGELTIGKEKKSVKYFIATTNQRNGNIQLESRLYHLGGEYAVVYMKSYGQVVVMDIETFNSIYVQMFILGKYDKRYFTPVVTSPYSRIYRLKI